MGTKFTFAWVQYWDQTTMWNICQMFRMTWGNLKVQFVLFCTGCHNLPSSKGRWPHFELIMDLSVLLLQGKNREGERKTSPGVLPKWIKVSNKRHSLLLYQWIWVFICTLVFAMPRPSMVLNVTHIAMYPSCYFHGADMKVWNAYCGEDKVNQP